MIFGSIFVKGLSFLCYYYCSKKCNGLGWKNCNCYGHIMCCNIILELMLTLFATGTIIS